MAMDLTDSIAAQWVIIGILLAWNVILTFLVVFAIRGFSLDLNHHVDSEGNVSFSYFIYGDIS